MNQLIIILLIVVVLIIGKFFGFIYDQISKVLRTREKEIERVKKFGKRNIDFNLSLIDRNEDIVRKHLNKVSLNNSRPYYIENSVRDCIDEIANAEGKFDLAPGYEYLSKWSERAKGEYLILKDLLLGRFKAKYNSLEIEAKGKRENDIQIKYISLKNKYANLITQFMEIAERKVSILDDYGDENWNELPKQINGLISKIASNEGYLSGWDKYSFSIPQEINLLREHLEKQFKVYHEEQKKNYRDYDAVNKMTGLEFETFISKILIESGYKVSGTATVGDQGADIIAKKGKRTFIIQTKRYSGSVGNKAVQEVVGALNYYKGNKACVITNSIFTKSAKSLAQKNKVILVDGKSLNQIDKILGRAI